MSDISNYSWDQCVGPGWKELVEEFVRECERVGGKIFDVKEKWGGLRIYFSCNEAWDDHLQKLADDLEDKSFKICEDCGAPGIPKMHYGWIRTLCDGCRGDTQ